MSTDGRWNLGAHGQVFGAWGRIDSDGNAARLDTSTGGFFMGADVPLGDWRMGLMAGHSHANFDAKDRSSSGDSDNFHLGLYGGTQWGALGFRFGAAYTRHDIGTSRAVAIPGLTDSLTGGYDADTFQAFGEFGYRIEAGGSRFEPFAGLAHVNLDADGLHEGGGVAALTGDGGTTETTFSTLGLRASTAFDLDDTVLTAKGMVGWRRAFGDIVPLSTMRFDGGDAFSIAGVPIARNAAVIEAGLDLAIAPTATLGISYGGQFGSGVADQSFRASFNVKF